MCLIPELQYLLSIYDSPHATWVGETSVDEIRFFSISSSGHQPRPSRGSKIHKLYKTYRLVTEPFTYLYQVSAMKQQVESESL